MAILKLKSALELSAASTMVDAALREGRERSLAPITVVVLDAGGHIVALKREDGSGILRVEVALAKAYGALGLGVSSRAIAGMAIDRPHFGNALAVVARGRELPVPGGVLIVDESEEVIGAVGVSGDTSDNDEICAIAGVRQAGYRPEPPEGSGG